MRKSAERHNRKQQRSARERRERDKRVSERHGERGHRACGRKRRYATKDMALRYMLISACKSGLMMTAYQCPYCGGWHLTKQRSEDA